MRRSMFTAVTAVAVMTFGMTAGAHAEDEPADQASYGAATAPFEPTVQPPAVDPAVLSAGVAAPISTLPVTGGSSYSQLQLAASLLAAGSVLVVVSGFRKRSERRTIKVSSR